MFDITQVDPNLLSNNSLSNVELHFYNVRSAPVDFYGLYDPRGEAPFRRMPPDIAKTVSRSVYNLSQQTAGGRIRFKTDSKIIALHVTQREKVRYFSHMTFLGTSGFDLYRIENGRQIYVKSILPPVDRDYAWDGIVELPDNQMREYVLNFPLYDWVTDLYLGLEPSAELEAGTPYTAAEKPVVFYGSSTTQGGCASRPGTFHCALLSRWLDMDYLCLGFSGSAKGETEMADYLATLDPAAYVLEYDGNAPDPEHLQMTHEPMFQKIRQTHPEVPILICTRTAHSGWDDREEARRRSVIRTTYEHAVSSGDTKVWYMDRHDIFKDTGHKDCTVDGVHPNDLGFWCMASAMKPILTEMLLQR